MRDIGSALRPPFGVVARAMWDLPAFGLVPLPRVTPLSASLERRSFACPRSRPQ
jgi:hypothetical protein